MERISWGAIASKNLDRVIGAEVSGVYAWHYNLRLSKYDISRFVDVVSATDTGINDSEKKRGYIKAFLSDKLLSLFKYPDYTATASGPLLPKYTGMLSHEINITSSLVDRLIADPSSIGEISDTLSKLSPEFSNPLYIGMASNIKKRLLQHKDMIVRISEDINYQIIPEITSEEKNFAERVNQRGFVLDNLFVCVEKVSDKGMVHNSVENIMNRISYPSLGKN